MSQGLIKKLDSHIINQIAAGEVVERPSSVIKELVENSLDAGAKHITVSIREGGKSAISITDDGVGMIRDDLALCLERHATSKLTDNDLWNLNTFGFRGEALPSIASVSRVKIQTKHERENHGWEIKAEGSLLESPAPCPLSQGTVIHVTDLFFATPARLKFLKSATTEYTSCGDVLKRLALVNPNVAFTFINEGKEVFAYPAESLQERCHKILGPLFAQSSCPVNYNNTEKGVVITGFISLPTFHKSQASDQYLFVNKRMIKDKLLTSAFRVAYQDVLESGRHGVGVVFIDMPLEEVDVNAHPAKTEVRFRDSQYVRGALISAIRSSLTAFGQQSSGHLSERAFQRFDVPRYGAHFSGGGGGTHTRTSSTAGRPTVLPLDNIQAHYYRPSADHSLPTSIPLPNQNQEEPQKAYPLGHPKTQLFNMFIISETQDALILVDQHAAHERILYEKLKNQHQADKKQYLVSPEIIELGEENALVLAPHKDTLSHLGLVLDFYGSSIAVVAVPPALFNYDLKMLILDLVADLEVHDRPESLETYLLEKLATNACKRSIKAGDRLNYEEMNALLREMENTPDSAQCNHGRPTYVTLKKDQIEKLFERR